MIRVYSEKRCEQGGMSGFLAHISLNLIQCISMCSYLQYGVESYRPECHPLQDWVEDLQPAGQTDPGAELRVWKAS